MALLHSILSSGVSNLDDSSQKRSILLANIISLILFSVSIMLMIIYVFWFRWNFTAVIILIVAILSLIPILLNRIGAPVAGKFMLCMLGPLSTLSLSVYTKFLWYEYQADFDYFNYRIIMLASCLFPAVLFSLREKFYLILASSISFGLLMLHDPIHYLFEVPYRGTGTRLSDYYFTNVVIFITYGILVGTVIFLKKVSDDSERKAEKLIAELNRKNSELLDKNSEIEAQNHEIIAQTDSLNQSQEKLQNAYNLIDEQKELLLKLNKELSSELTEINNDLTATNNELIRHNNELRQFSYTVSHNLRGPVASLSGLINLMDTTELSAENVEIYGHIKTSIQRLEAVIKDLSHIIDIRNDIFSIRRKISLEHEIKEILAGLSREITEHDISITIDVQKCAEVYSVKPMVHSILYNLITNAIKYKSDERRSQIKISAYNEGNYHVLDVTDNGLGIDLTKHRQNIFKLYKRFHTHKEGKGLGLYLVKLQAESLGGKIELESEVNHFTKFKVYISIPENVEQQQLYRSQHAKIFYDGKLNATGIIWNGPVSSDQYRDVFIKCLEFVKVYNTPNYIADLTNQGYINREDQQWMFQNILPEAARNGLQRIAAIHQQTNDSKSLEYINGIRETLIKLGIEQRYFNSSSEAVTWLEEQSRHTQVKAS